MPTRRVKESDRRRCVRACRSCKRRKERCDGQQPCRRCVSRNALDCTFDQPPPSTGTNRTFPGQVSKDRSGGVAGPGPFEEQAPPARTILESATTNSPSTPGTGHLGTTRVFHGSPSAVVPQLTRLVLDGRGKYMFVGDSGNLSFLQIIRRIAGDCVGPCEFIDDPLRHHVVEATPESRSNWIIEMVLRPPSKPMLSDADYFVRWYLRATNGIVNMFDESELRRDISQWIQEERVGEPLNPTGAIFFLILAIGAQTCPEDRDDLAEGYFDYGKLLTTSGVTEDPSISTIRAYVLITMYLLAASRRNAAFMYLGIAVRAAHALGIHRRDINLIFGDAEGTMREQLWKVLRTLDLFMSASLGRPPCTSESRETRAELNYSTSNDLSALFESILNQVYSKRMVTTEALESISQHHREWAARYPSGLAVDGIPPEVTVTLEDGTRAPNIGLYHLKASYYWTIMLLSRPFLIESVSRHQSKASTERPPSENLAAAPPSDQVLPYACIDSAVRAVDLLGGLHAHAKLPKRLPFIVNSLFVSALVLGLSQFGDLDTVFPLDKTLAAAQKLLALFSRHDPVARRNFSIVQNLRMACDAYVEKRTRRKIERQSLLISGLFGSVHSSSTSGQPSQRHTYRDPSFAGAAPAADLSEGASVYHNRAVLPAGPGRPEQDDGVSGEAVQMMPDLASITDMSLPMSPRTVLFDSFDKTIPLFSMIGGSFSELDNEAIETLLQFGTLE